MASAGPRTGGPHPTPVCVMLFLSLGRMTGASFPRLRLLHRDSNLYLYLLKSEVYPSVTY
jgi:hypothetical protein